MTLPTTPVEVLVAASIIAAAMHAVKPWVPRGEIAISALFGLVNGSAFATTILDLQLTTAATASALLGFSIGVELAQLVAVALVLPLIVLVARTRAHAMVRGLLGAAAAAAAVAWIVAILTGTDSVLTPFFDAIAARSVVAYGVAAALAVIVWSLAPRTDTPAVSVVARSTPTPGVRTSKQYRGLEGHSHRCATGGMSIESLSAGRDHLSEVIDRVEHQHERVIVPRNGRASAVLISPEDWFTVSATRAASRRPCWQAPALGSR